jgi:hypothetical protein
MAWAFLSGYFTGMTAQNIQLIDYSCSSGTVRVIIRNAGTQGIDMGASCALPGGAGTTVATCGSMTILKTTGTFAAAPTTNPTGSIAVGSTTVFSETGLAAGSTHTYRFTTTTGAGGPSPNVATVNC